MSDPRDTADEMLAQESETVVITDSGTAMAVTSEPSSDEEPAPEAPRQPRHSKTRNKTMPTTSPAETGDFNLAQAIKDKLDTLGLSIATAAQELGISALVIRNIFDKGSKPNSRTVGKLAEWLGVDAALAGARPEKIAKVPKSPKAPKAPKAAKAAKPPKVAKIPKAAKAPKVKKEMPIKSSKGRGRPPKAVVKTDKNALSTSDVLAIVKAAIDQAAASAKPTENAAIVADKLAMQVHKANDKMRGMVAMMIEKFS